jgi:hypothetical protein
MSCRFVFHSPLTHFIYLWYVLYLSSVCWQAKKLTKSLHNSNPQRLSPNLYIPSILLQLQHHPSSSRIAHHAGCPKMEEYLQIQQQHHLQQQQQHHHQEHVRSPRDALRILSSSLAPHHSHSHSRSRSRRGRSHSRSFLDPDLGHAPYVGWWCTWRNIKAE